MWFFRPSRRWDWLQLEVSSQCPAACIYCPTALFREEGNNRLMTMETFNRILPAFSRSRMVFLQGWGEPFMNPNLFEMFRQAKASGCLVGTTTNGMLLDAGRLERLVNGGVDIVAFSLAGCGKTNDAVRKGTSLARLLEVIHRLNRIKGNTGSSRPEIHIAYMLLRSGLDEIERLPILLAGQGIAQVVVSTLDFVPVPEIAREALVPSDPDQRADLRARLERLVAAGKRSGLEIHCQMADFQAGQQDDPVPAGPEIVSGLPVQRPACTENVRRAAFISAGGYVSPCVYTNLPVASPSAVPGQGGRPYRPLIFGNIHDQSLDEIWHSKAYRAFRKGHRSGRLEGPCRGCTKTALVS